MCGLITGHYTMNKHWITLDVSGSQLGRTCLFQEEIPLYVPWRQENIEGDY